MEIVKLIALLADFTSFFSFGKEVSDHIKENKLSPPSIDFSDIPSDLEFYADRVDRYLTSKYDSVVFGSVITAEERNEVKEEFYKHNTNLLSMREYTDRCIDSYLDQLNELLYSRMSVGEKFIKKQIEDLEDHISDRFNSQENTSDQILDEIKIVSEKIDTLLQNNKSNQYIKKYYDRKKHEFEDAPKEPKVVGDLSIEKAYIDIEVDKNHPEGNRASEYIIRWCRHYDFGAHFLFGLPGHGKTTLGLKLVHDYIVGNVDFKVFCFSLVSRSYRMIDKGVIQIPNVLRLDGDHEDSILDDALIENSLIILDGYDELQTDLSQDDYFADPVNFFNTINEFAINKKARILITSRSIIYENLPKERKKDLRAVGDIIRMKLMTEEDQYEWIKKHKPDYYPHFQQLRQTYLRINESKESVSAKEDIFGIPFIFLMTVAAEFCDDADNLVQLYDKLFESTLKRREPVISANSIAAKRKPYEDIAFEMLETNGKYVTRSGADKQDYSLYTYSFYMKVHMDETECASDLNYRYIEFYHRTFYEYFMAYSLYNQFTNATEDNVDDFLYSLGKGNLDYYILKYIRQIIRNRGKKRYNETVQRRIEKTDALIFRDDDNPLLRCNQIFTNALMLMNVFADGVSIHEDIGIDFSSYKQTKLCQLLRQYRCINIDLSGCKMIGAHMDRSDLRRSDFTGSNMSGKADMSFSFLQTCNFTDANMNKIQMYRSVLDSSTFYNTDMSEGRFEEGSFKKAKFTGADLRNSNFKKADLTNARFMDVKIDEKTDFTFAILDGLVTNVDLSCCIPKFHNLVENGVIIYKSTEM